MHLSKNTIISSTIMLPTVYNCPTPIQDFYCAMMNSIYTFLQIMQRTLGSEAVLMRGQQACYQKPRCQP